MGTVSKVPQIISRWNQIRASLEQWKSILQPSLTPALQLNYHKRVEVVV